MTARDLPPEQLLRQCRWETFRGPGPGGQKRNKTSSAVRVVHQPTGLTATAGESRSQAENRQRAFHRLQLRMALEWRHPFEPSNASLPAWLDAAIRKTGQLPSSPRAKNFLPTVGIVLDALAATGWSVSKAADALQISTGALVSFLALDPAVWAKVNQMRQLEGLRNLNP